MPGLLDLPLEILSLIFEQVLIDHDLQGLENDVKITRADDPVTGNVWLAAGVECEDCQVEVLGFPWITQVACGFPAEIP